MVGCTYQSDYVLTDCNIYTRNFKPIEINSIELKVSRKQAKFNSVRWKVQQINNYV
jgi:hypothetical protein